MDLEATKAVLGFFGAAIALAGFIFGLYQYVIAQHWKRAEFASKELDKLNSDPLLAMACTLLDWYGRTLKVPESYKYKAEADTFTHSWEILEIAMSPGITPDNGRDGYTWQEVIYRDIFDHFFTYLSLLNHYTEIKLIKTSDIAILKYWFEQISGSNLAGQRPIFQRFIKEFGYEGVNSLSLKLGVDPKLNM